MHMISLVDNMLSLHECAQMFLQLPCGLGWVRG